MPRRKTVKCSLCKGRLLPKGHNMRTCPMNSNQRQHEDSAQHDDDRRQDEQVPEDEEMPLETSSNVQPEQTPRQEEQTSFNVQPEEATRQEEELPAAMETASNVELDEDLPQEEELPDIDEEMPLEGSEELPDIDGEMLLEGSQPIPDNEPRQGNPHVAIIDDVSLDEGNAVIGVNGFNQQYCDATVGENNIIEFALSSDERRALFEICQRFGLLLRDIVSRPGDCLFIVVKVLLGIPDSITEMRQKVHDRLMTNLDPHDWASSTEGGAQTFPEYLTSIRGHGYGDQHVLTELCSIYRFNYSVIKADGWVAQSAFEGITRRIYSGFLPELQHYVPAFPMHTLRLVPTLALPFVFLTELVVPEWANVDLVRLLFPLSLHRQVPSIRVASTSDEGQRRPVEAGAVPRRPTVNRPVNRAVGSERPQQSQQPSRQSGRQPREGISQLSRDESHDVEPCIIEHFPGGDSNGLDVANILIGPGAIRQLVDDRCHYVSKADESEICANCARVSTDAMKLTFKRRIVRTSGRKWGKMRRKKGMVTLCSSCIEWLMGGKGLDYAWPAVIYTILTEDLSEDLTKKILAFIPWRWRQSWNLSVEEFSVHVQNLWTTKSRIRDVTIEKTRFNAEVHSGQIKLWNAAINRVPIETVVCPLGCHCHYIDTMGKKFMDLFMEVAEKETPNPIFKSRRGDWPYRGNVLNWEVAASVEIVEDIPHILFCNDHSDSELKKEFIHIPRHPLCSSAWMQQDNLAPAAVVPTVVRNPRLKKWTSSTHVVNEFGGYNGLSSFHLVPDCNEESEVDFQGRTTELAQSKRLVFERRPDVASQHQQRDGGLREMEFCHKTKSISAKAIQAARQGSSFVSLHDATEGWKSAVFKDSASQSQVRKSHSLVHPCPKTDEDCSGQSQQILPFAENSSQLLMMLVYSIVHCPPLELMYKDPTQGSNNRIVTKLLDIILAKKKAQRTFREKFKTFSTSLTSSGVEMSNVDVWTRLRVPGLQICNELDLFAENEDTLNGVKILLVINENFSLDANFMPLDIGDLYMQGVYCKAGGKFRWEETFSFQELGEGLDSNSWEWAVFARKESSDEVLDLVKKSLSNHSDWAVCKEHRKALSHIKRLPASQCCIVRCKNLITFKCLEGFPDSTCDVGICRRHEKEIDQQGQVVEIDLSSALPQRLPDIEEEDDDSVLGEDSGPEEANEEDELLFNEEVDLDDIEEMNVLDMASGNNQEDDLVGPDQIPLFAKSDVPVLHDVLGTTLPSHFYLNSGLQVMRRKGFHGRPPSHPVLNHVVSRVSNNPMALMYPEGLFFPKIFWDSVPQAQAVTGALPSCMFYGQGESKFVEHLGSLNEHLKVRVRDKFSHTSRSPCYIHFVFDVLVNEGFQKSTTSIFRDKGLEFIPQVRNMGKAFETSMSFDEVTASLKKKELAHLIREGKWDYFLTITCNDSLSPGVKEISKAIHQRHYDKDFNIEARLVQEFQPTYVTAWRRTVNLFMDYLLESTENMLGDVDKLFMRWEFQSAGALGNKPHVHCGLTLKSEPTEETLKRVVCTINGLLGHTERTTQEGLEESGLVNGEFSWGRLLELRKIQKHSCQSAQSRCMKRINDEGQTVCRVPVHPESRHYFYEEVPTKFDEHASDILEGLGLLQRQAKGKVTLDEDLQGGRWHYPSEGFRERAIPTVPELFAVFKASTNVQVCDRRFQVAYLVKYATKTETHAFVKAKGQKDVENVGMEKEPVRNLHFSTDARAEKKKQDKDKKKAVVREVAYTEVLWQVHQYDYVRTNVEFVHVSTQSAENRSQMLKFSRHPSAQDSSRSDFPVCVERNGLDEQFSEDQKMFIDEYMRSSYIIDRTSRFNVRPPELALFDNLLLFYKLFVRQTKSFSKDQELPEDLASRPWVDGLCGVWKIRRTMIGLAVAHLERKHEEGEELALALLEFVFWPLAEAVQEEEYSVARQLFVEENCSEHVIVVPSMVRPFAAIKFFYHLCMSMGRMRTEMDFMGKTSILSSLQAVGLVPEDGNNMEEALQSLFQQYVTKDLMFNPVSNSVFQRMLKAADFFFNGLRENEITYDPSEHPVFESDLAEDSRRRLKTNQEERRRSILLSIQGFGIDFPQELINDPEWTCDWNVQPEPFPNQVQDSIAEQEMAINICKNAIDRSIAGEVFTRFPILVGPPGTGKTYLMMRAVAYAISKGLKVNILSMTGERARSLGGQHVHLAFSYPVSTGITTSSSVSTANCLGSLQNNPMKVALLAQTDVFFFDELSMISGEMFSSLDYILQKVMDCNLPWGGKLVIATGDHKQLSPIQGHPIWTSTHILTTFNLIKLCNYVRSAEDPMLQRALDVIRLSNPTVEEKEELNGILAEGCVFVSDWDEVPLSAMRVVSTRKAEQRVREQFVAKLRADQVEMKTFVASDEVENATGNWIAASASASKVIDREVLEPKSLVLYVGALVRLTYNRNTDPVFSQGQLAFVTELPDENLPEGQQKLGLRLVPSGVMDVTTERPEWPVVRVSRRVTPSVLIRGQMQQGRRTQWPVCLYLVSTIHRIIGSTCPLLATRITSDDPDFHLWEKEQLLVLVSRVPRLSSLIFVGSRNNILATVTSCMSIRNPWKQHIDELVDVMNDNHRAAFQGNVQEPIRLNDFRAFYRQLPSQEAGYVYILVSRTGLEAYVGETNNLLRRLREHNSGYDPESGRRHAGARSTRHHHNWGVLGLVTGFQSVEGNMAHERKQVERAIHTQIGRRVGRRGALSPLQTLEVAQTVVAELNRTREFRGRLVMSTFMNLLPEQEPSGPEGMQQQVVTEDARQNSSSQRDDSVTIEVDECLAPRTQRVEEEDERRRQEVQRVDVERLQQSANRLAGDNEDQTMQTQMQSGNHGDRAEETMVTIVLGDPDIASQKSGSCFIRMPSEVENEEQNHVEEIDYSLWFIMCLLFVAISVLAIVIAVAINHHLF